MILTLVFLFAVNFQGLSNPLSILFAGLGSPPQAPLAASPTDILWLVLFTWLIATGLGAAAAMYALPFPEPAGRGNESPSRSRRRDGAANRRNNVSLGRVMARSAVLYGLVLFAAWLIYGLVHAARLLPSARTGTVAEQLDHIASHYSLYTWLVVLWCLLGRAGLGVGGLLPRQGAPWLGRGLATIGATALFSTTVLYIIGGVKHCPSARRCFLQTGTEF